jgi:hypothetical protein
MMSIEGLAKTSLSYSPAQSLVKKEQKNRTAGFEIGFYVLYKETISSPTAKTMVKLREVQAGTRHTRKVCRSRRTRATVASMIDTQVSFNELRLSIMRSTSVPIKVRAAASFTSLPCSLVVWENIVDISPARAMVLSR